MKLRISHALRENCRQFPERAAWLERLPAIVSDLEARWALTLDDDFLGGEDSTCSWVAAVLDASGRPAVLKISMPHMEGEHEIQGLRFWAGVPTVRLLDSCDEMGAMLLERCRPGTALRVMAEHEQDAVIAGLLRCLWRQPPEPQPFRPLATMTNWWAQETLIQPRQGADMGLVREGLRLFEELPRTASRSVLLATDLHAGNVVSAEREPWLVIDPKPFVGDPAYDTTQHLLNCRPRLRTRPEQTIRTFADLAGVDHERVRLWTFARAAAEPRDNWHRDELSALARVLAG